jgi:hypothetical protein
VFVGKEDASHMYKGFRWVVAGSSHRIVDAAGVPALPMSVYVAADRSPPEVDEVDEVNRDYPTYRAVYRRNGDVLRWAESKGVERPRPTSFDPARGVTVWTLRRVK